MRKLFSFLSVLCAMGFFYAGCKHELFYPGGYPDNTHSKPPDPVSTCSPDSVYFVNTVLPILTSNCAMSGCHDAASHREGLVLNTYSGIMGIVRSGNANSSKLVSVITTNDRGDVMPPPPAAKLSGDQINAIRTWINQGAKNNNCSACDSALYTFSGAVQPIISTQCAGCHSGSSAGGGIDLSAIAGIRSAANSGKLMGSINHSVGFVAMPQGGYKLPDCQIAQIQKWIDSGMPNN